MAELLVDPPEARRPAAARRSSRRCAARPRSPSDRRSRPARRHAMRNGALGAERRDADVSAAIRHSAPRSGWPGSPSNSTIVEPIKQARHEQVPHHPPGRGEPEEPVARRRGRGAARGTWRARGGCRRARARSASAGRSCPTRTARTADARTARARTRAARAGTRSSAHDVAPCGGGASGSRYGTAIVVSTVGSAARSCATSSRRSIDAIAVAVAVDGEQHLGLDLAEPVDDRPDAELRRARRPHRAEARRREHRHECLGGVGQVRGHTVAAPDTEPSQSGARPCHGVAQFGRT